MALFRCGSGSGGGSQTDTGTFVSNQRTLKLNFGFKPKQLVVYRSSTSPIWNMIYDENYSTTSFFKCVSSSSSFATLNRTTTSNFDIKSIDDDGATFMFKDSAYDSYQWNYIAIG